ncbi:hydroxyacid dehydrogenase [Polynucleobacter antarcticus]|uniref:3-phosphoglycerate dehydrogenase n=1 Tax=Polynucleobacter antarcticus TaxID=1743162 RepID=A0A6M9PHY7_9BURK|nr:hydroxyacid dehydrogenase [Polynucleobacter antarcticus]QKM62470.1 3-phosphoglycerate dehydrogenase [Polynucleobacter antarcticus]
MKILIPEGILSESLDRLRAEQHEVIYNPELVNHHEKLIEAAQDVHAIIVRRLTQVRGELLDVMKNCKAVGRLGVGLDNIDVKTCRARGIEVIPAIGANARSVAEYVITTSMMLMRKAYLATDEVSSGKWPKARIDQGKEILGSTLGIIGLGSIGRATADLAIKLGFQVIAVSNPTSQEKQPRLDGIKYVSLEELITKSDIVSLHLPYTAESKNMIDTKSIAQMKSGAILINAARGGIVDDDALIEALHNGHLGGAAIDVFENEPLQKSAKYSNVPNLILTPHIAGITQQSESRVNKAVIDKILQVLSTK